MYTTFTRKGDQHTCVHLYLNNTCRQQEDTAAFQQKMFLPNAH